MENNTIKKFLEQIAKIMVAKGEYQLVCIKFVKKNMQAICANAFFLPKEQEEIALKNLFDNKLVQDAIETSMIAKKQNAINVGSSVCITPLIIGAEVVGVIVIGSKNDATIFGEKEKLLFNKLANNISYGILSLRENKPIYPVKIENENDLLAEIIFETLHEMSQTYELYDNFRKGHQYRVAVLSKAIAEKLKLDVNFIREIFFGASIHDIGKLNIPSRILNRPAKLITNEYEIIKKHPEFGLDIVKNVKFASPIPHNIIIQHHERYNGEGYPNKIPGEKIAFESRIVTVADVVEAMSGLRSYRPGFPIEHVLKEIEVNKNIQFDPELVDICIELFMKDNFEFPN